jgi:hypothetical protein
MLTESDFLALEKERLPAFAETLDQADLPMLVSWLSEQDDTLRYHALLVLQSRAQHTPDVYPFFDAFHEKLKSGNSYQRSIGVILMAANARWDTDEKLERALGDYLAILRDCKPITVRQCIQSLEQIIPYKPGLRLRVADALMAIPIEACRESMRKLFLSDILSVLVLIRRYEPSEKIEAYLSQTLSGGVLDRKTKQEILKLL